MNKTISKKLIIWFLKVSSITILMVLGFGLINVGMPLMYAAMVELGQINEDQFNQIVLAQWIISLSIIIYWVIWNARIRRCPNCKQVINF